MTPLEHFEEEFARMRRKDERKRVVTIWWQAVIMTRRERDISCTHRIKVSTTGDRVLRWLPYWDAITDDDLDDLYRHLQPLAQRRRKAR